MKLGKRLQQIAAMVGPGYDQIWDCCCDHGLLGMALLTRQVAPQIHFVDIIPALMEQLESRLQQLAPVHAGVNRSWQLHCQDVATLPLAQFPGRQLIIIAGVGGDLTARLVQSIIQRHPASTLDFLLCPTNRAFTLRAQLIALELRLQRELLVSERRRHYELMLLSTATDSGYPISPVGEQLWLSHTAEQAQAAATYRNRTLQYYQRMQASQDDKVQLIIAAYQQVALPHSPLVSPNFTPLTVPSGENGPTTPLY